MRSDVGGRPGITSSVAAALSNTETADAKAICARPAMASSLYGRAMKFHAFALLSFLLACSSSEGGETSRGDACVKEFGGAWKLSQTKMTSLVQPPGGSFCQTLIHQAPSYPALVSDDLRTLTVEFASGRSRSYEIQPVGAPCDVLVASKSEVSYREGATLRTTFTLRRQADGSLVGETEQLAYDDVDGPQNPECILTFATTVTR